MKNFSRFFPIFFAGFFFTFGSTFCQGTFFVEENKGESISVLESKLTRNDKPSYFKKKKKKLPMPQLKWVASLFKEELKFKLSF